MIIDAVVMWVNGNDPNWLEEKNKYDLNKITDANSNSRYRDWNLMKYWFRSIEKNIPWIRKVFFVTWGHVPDFLNINHPKLRIVKHNEFIPEQYLPTFSSHTIELNLYRIKDLSEHFILLNDDIFILNPLKPSYFFKDNTPCAYYSEQIFPLVGELEVWQWAMINDLRIINKHHQNKKSKILRTPFRYFNIKYSFKDNFRSFMLTWLCSNYYVGIKTLHSINAYNKNTFIELWDKEFDILNNTSMHKFRDATDVNQWLMLYWQIAKGEFLPQRNNRLSTVIDENHIQIITNTIEQKSYDVICINDPNYKIDFDQLHLQLVQSFEKIFPDKSSYEV